MNAADSPTLYWIGVAAALFLTAPALFSILKRSAARTDPRRWFAIHVAGSCIGAVLAIIHSGGNFGEPPALLLLLLLAIIGIGGWIRISQGSRFAGRMAARPYAFAGPDPSRRETLRALIEAKTGLLRSLDPGAPEAEFSPQLVHWLKSPAASLRYMMLVAREREIIGARADAGPVLYWSRWVHMGLGVIFLAGLIVHIVVAIWFPD